MGFTIGSGGGPPPDNSVSEDKIVDEAVSENKLSAAVVAQLGGGGPFPISDIIATGTPGASTFLRGDSTWAGAGTGVTLGSDSLESAGNTITIDLSSSPITDAQYIRINFEFEVDGACEVLLLLNGDADSTGYYVDGSANVATISTLPGAGAQRGGGMNITPSANSGGNLVCFGVADIWNPTSTIGDASLKWFKTLTGLTGITQIQLKTSANNFKAGSNVTITQVSGVGPKGDQGEQGPAGEGAVPWQVATQASNGSSLTLTLSPTGDQFEVMGQITSQSASSATEIEFNGSAGGHAYRQHFSLGADNGAGGYFPSGVVGSGVTCYFHGTVQRTGETIHTDLNVSLPASSLSHSIVYKAITGATAITALKLLSNQANGIGAGSFIKARKIG